MEKAKGQTRRQSSLCPFLWLGGGESSLDLLNVSRLTRRGEHASIMHVCRGGGGRYAELNAGKSITVRIGKDLYRGCQEGLGG